MIAVSPARRRGGRSFFIATTGNNGNNGSEAQPWATVTYAFASGQLRPGDRVVVQPGTYTEAPFIDAGGNATGYITLRAASAGTALFRPVSPNYGCVTLRAGANYIIIDGLDAVGPESHAVDLEDVHHIIVRNCILHDSAGSGASSAKCEWVTIENNAVFNNCATNPYEGSGISFYQMRDIGGDTTPGFRNIIRNNICYENLFELGTGLHSDGNGIIVDDFQHTQGSTGFPTYAYSTLVENNLCWGNGGKGIQVYLSDLVTVRNNTCWRNNLDPLNPGTWRGELSNSQCSSNTWVNNIGYADPGFNANNTAIAFTTHSSYVSVGMTWNNNLTFNGTPGQSSLKLDGGNAAPTAGNGNQLGVNPLFVSTASRDFHLQAGSPALNAGTSAFGVGTTDLEYLPRLFGVIDLGCYERQS